MIKREFRKENTEEGLDWIGLSSEALSLFANFFVSVKQSSRKVHLLQASKQNTCDIDETKFPVFLWTEMTCYIRWNAVCCCRMRFSDEGILGN